MKYLVLFLLSIFSQYANAHDFVFQTHSLKLGPCENEFANTQMEEMMQTMDSVAKFITGNPVPNPMFTPAEKLYYSDSSAYFLPLQAARGVKNSVFSEYCVGYSNHTALNAVLHFAVAATITFHSDPKTAKKMMDLHEAGESSSYDFDNQITNGSAMDIYNNYMGIEFATGFHGIPENRDPNVFFIEAGLRLLAQGKLRTIETNYDSQYCLMPKDPFTGPPGDWILNHPTDKKVEKYYTLYRPKNSPLTKDDREKVVQLAPSPEDDPLFQELYQRSQYSTCCDK